MSVRLQGSGILNFGPYATRGPELGPVWRDDRGAYVALVSSKACVEADTIGLNGNAYRVVYGAM